MPTVIALKDVLADLRGDPDLKNLPDNASVISDVGLDSLELLQFMLEIEASLAIEVDFLHPDYGDEDRAVAKSVKYLRGILHDGKAIRSR